jgi:hypothetical protein
MATLQSAGVSVSVIDESFYTPAGAGTVPMIFVATGQDKANGSGTATAQGTTAANAGKVWVITSQRDLTDTFGTPYFETDAEGNPVHGGELNEYGLQAAYSLLGVSSKAYIIRADVNTSELVASANAPDGNPVAGTYWISTDTSKFGINEWNSVTKKFTVKTPRVIDNTLANDPEIYDGNAPADGFGSVGEYAIVLTSDNDNTVFYKTSAGTWTEVKGGFDSGKKVVLAAHYDYPDFTVTGLNASTGSVWIKTTSPSQGAAWDVRYFNGTTSQWTSTAADIYSSTAAAIQKLDNTGGGNKIALGTVIIESDPNHGVLDSEAEAKFKAWIRYRNSPTTVSLTSTAPSATGTFTITETLANGTWSSAATIGLTVISDKLGKQISDKINQNSSLVNVSATWDPVTNRLTIVHALGGEIKFEQTLNQPLVDIGFGSSVANMYVASGYDAYDYIATNWKPLVYEAQPTAPVTSPADGTKWFDSGLDVDIMYNDGQKWTGYLNAFPATDPLGPTVAASAPTTQQDGLTALAFGDIWVDTSNPDMYGKNIYVYDGSAWVLQNVADHDTPDGWVFGDARWAAAGEDADAASIVALLSSDYVDPDAPEPRLFPRGTRLWNTRRSGNNVKQYHAGYIDINSTNPRMDDESMDLYATDRWVTASPNDLQDVGQFGRLAQRSVVIKALKALVTSNQAIRDTDTLNFNMIATPGYPELMQNMVEFNVDNGQTAIIIGDTPFRLEPNGTALTAYGKNTSLEADNNDAAAVTYSTELAMFYPSGFTNDNMGNNIVVPPSHMMMRTIVNSDNKSYLWFAPAGTRRGTIDNASSVGYLNNNGEYKTVSLHQGLRDVLQDPAVAINPIATLPGVGLVNMGQRTRAQNASALDRINVSRLIAYLRRQLAILAKPYLFEPNDSQTRHEVKAAVDSLMTELVSQRALYDFLVVCDSSNNTPARIDRSELWVDIAIEPVKAVEFIYIPLRIMNTGEIAASSK